MNPPNNKASLCPVLKSHAQFTHHQKPETKKNRQGICVPATPIIYSRSDEVSGPEIFKMHSFDQNEQC